MLLLKTALIAAACVLADSKVRGTSHNKPGFPIRGVDPALVSHYPSSPSGSFTCLSDPSIVVPYKSINDDYCDCPDGSDEPGTSACSHVPGRVKFWCANEGHVPGWVFASRVNDGICDPECCDGSDEWDSPVECPDVCAQVGAEHRARVAAEQKLRKTGSKIRATYIKYAAAERVKLSDKVKALEEELRGKEGEVEAARVRLERLENADRKQMERRKQSRMLAPTFCVWEMLLIFWFGEAIYLSLLTHRSVITQLRSDKKRLEEEVDELKQILKELSEGYNPNYQDMAVKAAVVGYTEKYGKADESAEKEEEGHVPVSEEDLDELEKVDLDSLLMSGESSTPGAEDDHETALYRIDQYIPDALYESYETVRDALLVWLIRFGLIGKTATQDSTSDAPHMIDARKKFTDLSDSLAAARNELSSTREALEKLGSEFGPEGEWKKLEGTCIDREQGDYTYTLCFFGKVTQRSNKDGATHHLGTYAGWNAPDAQPGTEAYYSKQLYNRGLKCWNGPERSVNVDLSCGTANEITHISEPEKCEYRFQVTSPALCWPLAEEKVEKGKEGKVEL
ncbi:hypothetical protein QFC20_006992 [Naganishia adeliensis]|uniref:Uncharacterized protein n=1 Tax=Naganishia adeliensis TaxID=92952 RepID=A0ACC2V440_9TREE|nr:hypothetical protein QFC20_006992 [Naganishia adeliensis]